jgi:hypothetical protein
VERAITALTHPVTTPTRLEHGIDAAQATVGVSMYVSRCYQVAAPSGHAQELGRRRSWGHHRAPKAGTKRRHKSHFFGAWKTNLSWPR